MQPTVQQAGSIGQDSVARLKNIIQAANNASGKQTMKNASIVCITDNVMLPINRTHKTNSPGPHPYKQPAHAVAARMLREASKDLL
jgi:hypothetical protein